MDGRSYYVCQVRLDRRDRFVIWYSNEHDGFVRDGRVNLFSSPTVEELTCLAADRGISLVPDPPVLFDFDRISAWCEEPSAQGIDCAAFLNAWNFFDDLVQIHDRAETAYSQLSWAAADVYEALFQGNNLPSVTRPGERSFVPTWTGDGIAEIQAVMLAGLWILRRRLPVR